MKNDCVFRNISQVSCCIYAQKQRSMNLGEERRFACFWCWRNGVGEGGGGRVLQKRLNYFESKHFCPSIFNFQQIFILYHLWCCLCCPCHLGFGVVCVAPVTWVLVLSELPMSPGFWCCLCCPCNLGL